MENDTFLPSKNDSSPSYSISSSTDAPLRDDGVIKNAIVILIKRRAPKQQKLSK
jgi:hypothetical protein